MRKTDKYYQVVAADETHHLRLQHLRLGLARTSSGPARITRLDTPE